MTQAPPDARPVHVLDQHRGDGSRVTGARELIVPFGQSAYIVRYAHNARREEVVILRIWHSREARE
jgi:plasmid stabilization system protein ParE